MLTSATLAVAGTFDFTEERLGLRAARTLVVESPFDYQEQALLYVPQHLPDPRDPRFVEAASAHIVELLKASEGRAFVLFTSYSQMRQVYDRVSFEIEYPTLLQGTGPRSACWTSSARHRTAFCSPRLRSGRELMSRAIS